MRKKNIIGKIFIATMMIVSVNADEDIDIYVPNIFSGKLNLKPYNEEIYLIEPARDGYLSIVGYNGVFCTIEIHDKKKKLLKRMTNGQPIIMKVKKDKTYYMFVMARKWCKYITIQYPDY